MTTKMDDLFEYLQSEDFLSMPSEKQSVVVEFIDSLHEMESLIASGALTRRELEQVFECVDSALDTLNGLER